MLILSNTLEVKMRALVLKLNALVSKKNKRINVPRCFIFKKIIVG